MQDYLVRAWQQLLGIERVGARDNFFELGGTSLGAMEMMIRLCREFDIGLPLETLIQHPTITALAKVAEQQILDDLSDLSDVTV